MSLQSFFNRTEWPNDESAEGSTTATKKLHLKENTQSPKKCTIENNSYI